MKTVLFGETGGIKAYHELLEFMQDSYNQLATALVSSEQTNTSSPIILSGCELIAGNEYSAGYMFKDSTIYYFEGGNSETGFITIIETVLNKVYVDGVSRPLYKTRTIQFGETGEGLWNLANLQRLVPRIRLNDLKINSDKLLFTNNNIFLDNVLTPTYKKIISSKPSINYNSNNLKVTFNCWAFLSPSNISIKLKVGSNFVKEVIVQEGNNIITLIWAGEYVKNTDVEIWASTNTGNCNLSDPNLICETIDAYI